MVSLIQHGPRPVDLDAPLWRYVRLPQLLGLLSGEITLPSIRTLKRHDPAEGRPMWDEIVQTMGFDNERYGQWRKYVVENLLGQEERKRFEKRDRLKGDTWNQELLFAHWIESIVATRYAFCFFESKHESMGMWRAYAPDGVAIQTSLRKLEAAFANSGRPWRASRMIYRDLSRSINADRVAGDPELKEALWRPFFLKRLEYESEKEIRLVTVDASGSRHVALPWTRPETWIQQVRISPDLWAGDADKLIALIEMRCPGLERRISHSLVRDKPALWDSIRDEADADVNRDRASQRWPGFMHEP